MEFAENLMYIYMLVKLQAKKYIEVEFDCHHYSKYIPFQQILKYCVITGSALI